mmetsp:Transcript_4182/g.8682  ORF Transcript_4182/g.8682 Transcript_4182/m.8682 type:complete len:382 (-) Transcript_4182:806-1951(-)
MDEEGGIRRSRRGRKKNNRNGLSAAAGEASSEDETLGLDSLEDEAENRDLLHHHEDYEEGEERTGFLRPPSRQQPRRGTLSKTRAILDEQSETETWLRSSWLYKTLLPDTGLSIRGHAVLEASGFATKFLKFVLWTFISIALVHVVVSHLFDDRDKLLKLAHVWRYESDLIVRDCLIFFIVGRLWEKPGIDHAAWMLTALFANVYFESQNFVWFLQHSVTLFQMHCIWPWELWIFALVLVVAATGLVCAHALKAWRDRLLIAKLTEVFLCIIFFMAPVITSNYFHMHHWYAGWLMGMHFNYNTWWSRLSMAWCWGMYVNGIAVYGRDPVLTCEYAYFLTIDNRCPYIQCYLEGLADVNNTSVKEMVPVDWRNCSATDEFIP